MRYSKRPIALTMTRKLGSCATLTSAAAQSRAASKKIGAELENGDPRRVPVHEAKAPGGYFPPAAFATSASSFSAPFAWTVIRTSMSGGRTFLPKKASFQSSDVLTTVPSRFRPP